ncbi:unnamed protein product, partial [Staurois parvus]
SSITPLSPPPISSGGPPSKYLFIESHIHTVGTRSGEPKSSLRPPLQSCTGVAAPPPQSCTGVPAPPLQSCTGVAAPPLQSCTGCSGSSPSVLHRV